MAEFFHGRRELCLVEGDRRPEQVVRRRAACWIDILSQIYADFSSVVLSMLEEARAGTEEEGEAGRVVWLVGGPGSGKAEQGG